MDYQFLSWVKNIGCMLRGLIVFGSFMVATICFSQEPSAQKAESDQAPAESALIQLESTFIGDKEQPSVSYFIPWKGTDSPDGLKWNIERKNDDTLNIVDRDIMLRSMNIYNEMNLEK
jgi:hypothetical protein